MTLLQHHDGFLAMNSIVLTRRMGTKYTCFVHQHRNDAYAPQDVGCWGSVVEQDDARFLFRLLIERTQCLLIMMQSNVHAEGFTIEWFSRTKRSQEVICLRKIESLWYRISQLQTMQEQQHCLDHPNPVSTTALQEIGVSGFELQ